MFKGLVINAVAAGALSNTSILSQTAEADPTFSTAAMMDHMTKHKSMKPRLTKNEASREAMQKMKGHKNPTAIFFRLVMNRDDHIERRFENGGTLMKISAATALFALVVTPLAATSPLARADEMKMSMGETPADRAFMASMQSMMKNMKMKPTGNTDADFVLMMTPHHQGAIDMARVELRYGKDPELRQLATDIIAAQEKEIAEMKAWLGKNKK